MHQHKICDIYSNIFFLVRALEIQFADNLMVNGYTISEKIVFSQCLLQNMKHQ
jgi:hypothetical protein